MQKIVQLIALGYLFSSFHQNLYGQMSTNDSLIQADVYQWRFDCYDYSYRLVAPTYSNGRDAFQIYSLADKDSVVTYYYNGVIASIGLYYGCVIDTLYSTNYVEIVPGKNIGSYPLEVGETPRDYSVVVDSVRYMTYTSYELHYYPIYTLTFFDQDGKIKSSEVKCKGNYIHFASIERNKYPITKP